MPADPAARAFARMTEDVCDTKYEAITSGFGEVRWFSRSSSALADTFYAAAAQQTATLQAWLMAHLDA